MRTINAAALAEINKEYGLEALNIVRVWWNGIEEASVDYSDKKEGLEQYGVLGRVIEVTGLDNVISLDRSGASASVTIKLDDVLGDLRTIINNTDIHKRKVQILQWFADRPKTDAFPIFTGRINTPIEWSEADRTLTITVVSEIENWEFGFSVEEGRINAVPVTAFGKAFPVVFGQVFKVPALMLSESPSGILAQGFAWLFDDAYQSELDDLALKRQQAFDIAQGLYQLSILTELAASKYNDVVFPENNDYSQYLSLHQQAEQYYQQYLQYMDEYLSLGMQIATKQADYDAKKAYALKQVFIASQNFPRGIPVIVEIGQTRFTARFDGVVMTIGDIVLPPNEAPKPFYFSKQEETDTHTATKTTTSQEKFRWFDAGSKIRVISVPLYYIACIGAGSQIMNVFARRNGVRIVVPQTLYTVTNVSFSNDEGHTVIAKLITMIQPLTTLYDLNYEQLYESDEIWCDIRGEVAGDFYDIMVWSIDHFTDLSPDAASFGTIAVKTAYAPMNFAVLDRKDTLTFIRELCYQARVSIWVDNKKVFLRYLPEKPTATVTITPDDIVEGTLVITTDDTETLITKTIALWRTELDQKDPNKFIIRYNIRKYGVHEEETDYYAFQLGQLVRRAASYWAVRRGNTWKKLQFTTHIGKLQLESQDPVLMSGFNGMFSNNDVTGIVETAVFDSANLTIAMTVWLPIRWGEMDPYIFAFPQNVTALFGEQDLEFATGNPFQNAKDDTGIMDKANHTFQSYNAPPINRTPYQINDAPIDVTFDTALMNIGINFNRPLGLSLANERTDYQLKTPTIKTTTTAEATNVDMGTVMSANEDGSYTVKLLGTENLVKVTQVQIAEGFQVAPTTVVHLLKKGTKWFMQSPVWAPE